MADDTQARSIPWQAMLNARMRAQRAGVPCTLRWEDFPDVPDACGICSRGMRFYSSDKRFRPSLDRIVPATGYVPGNVRWICQSCNSRKSSRLMSDDEIRERLKFA